MNKAEALKAAWVIRHGRVVGPRVWVALHLGRRLAGYWIPVDSEDAAEPIWVFLREEGIGPAVSSSGQLQVARGEDSWDAPAAFSLSNTIPTKAAGEITLQGRILVQFAWVDEGLVVHGRPVASMEENAVALGGPIKMNLPSGEVAI